MKMEIPKELREWTQCLHCNSYIDSPNGKKDCHMSGGHTWVTRTEEMIAYFK